MEEARRAAALGRREMLTWMPGGSTGLALLVSLTILIGFAFTFIAFQAQAAGTCPAGMTPTDDGYCIAAGQTYCGGGTMCANGLVCGTGEQAGRCVTANGCMPNEIEESDVKMCMPDNWSYCGSGGACPPGTQCAPGGCLNLSSSPMVTCPNGARIPAGYGCYSGGGYDPSHTKVCSPTGGNGPQWLCNIQTECGAEEPGKSNCLMPWRQTAATPQTQAPPPSATTVSGKPASQQASAQNKGWVAPGSAAECQKLAQSSVARNTAAYYDLCVSDPPSRAALKTARASSGTKQAAAMPPPSPLSDFGCTWYGGSLRSDGACWIIGVTTSDCNDMQGRVTEDGGYKYCVLGGGGAPQRVASAARASSPAAASDNALDQCRDGAAAPWNIVGCYDLLGQPAAENRPGALRAKLRESLEAGMRAAEQQSQESAEDAAAQARAYRDWRADAVRRYDRWVAEQHDFVPESTAARDACTGRWTYDGTSPGSCDPQQSRARWELTFETRQPPSAAEAERVADNRLPWRTNSETDCRDAGGIPVRPTTENDITGIPPQLLADPTVNQASLRRSFLCYQTLGRSH